MAADPPTGAANQVSATAQSLSQAASEQAASVEQTSASIEHMSASISQNSDNARITDPRSHRIRLPQLADPLVRARLKALWTDPLSLDPSRVSARVTREVAAELAALAKSLEAAGPHDARAPQPGPNRAAMAGQQPLGPRRDLSHRGQGHRLSHLVRRRSRG